MVRVLSPRTRMLALTRLAPTLALLLLAAPAAADEPDPSTRAVTALVRLGVDVGGTKVASAAAGVMGDYDERQLSARAGQLFTGALGALVAPGGPWAVEATAGCKFDKLTSHGTTVSFTRFPIDLVASVAGRGHRLGVGPTVHLAPRLGCSDRSVCGPDLQYPAAVGGVLQYAWRTGQGFGMEAGARLTRIRYRGPGLPSLNGDCVGVFVGVWL